MKLLVPFLCAILAGCDSKSGSGSSSSGPSSGPAAASLERALLTIPSGALAGPAEILVAERDPKAYPGEVVAGKVWDIRVNGQEHTEFLRPAEIRVPYDPALVPAGMFVTLSVWQGGAWERVPGAVVDAATKSVVAPVWHLSEYAPTVTDADVQIVSRWYGTYMKQATRGEHWNMPGYATTAEVMVTTAKIVAREELLKLGDWGEMRRFVVESVTVTYTSTGCNADVEGTIYKSSEPVSVSHTLSERELQSPMYEGLHERIVAQRLEAARLKGVADALEAALPQALDRSKAEAELKDARYEQVTAQHSVRSLEFNSYAAVCDFNAGGANGEMWANAQLHHPSFTYEETNWGLVGAPFEMPTGQGESSVTKKDLIVNPGAKGPEGSVIREERAGERSSETTTFVRARMDGTDKPRELVVKGEVLHRLLVAGAAADAGAITDSPGQNWANIGPRVIPAAGRVKLEAFLTDTRNPVAGEPVAKTTTGADGSFELRISGRPEQSLRILATWENTDAQLKEEVSLEFPMCMPFLIGEALAGVGPLIRLPAVSRQSWVYARFADAPVKFELGSSLLGGVLTSEGERKIEVSFKGADALMLGTFVRRATHVNQGLNPTTVKVRARLDEARAACPEGRRAEINRRIAAETIDEDGKIELTFSGQEVCFPTSVLMALDALGFETVTLDADGKTALLATLAQNMYDKTDERARAERPTVNWDDPDTGSSWPFADRAADNSNTKWLLSIQSWRPWQDSLQVDLSLHQLYPDIEVDRVTDLTKVNVFADGVRPAVLRHLGSGAVLVSSFAHQSGTHLILLLGLVLDNAGKPVRWIFNDPNGDLSLHPTVDGYYGGTANHDVDNTAHRGAYAPYGNAPHVTQAKAGAIATKYYLAVRRSGAFPSPAELRAKLLPGSGR